jgi:hypothetical protein
MRVYSKLLRSAFCYHGTVLHADEASSWNDLHALFEMKRINHERAYSLAGACWAESFFGRMRRAEPSPHWWISADIGSVTACDSESTTC